MRACLVSEKWVTFWNFHAINADLISVYRQQGSTCVSKSLWWKRCLIILSMLNKRRTQCVTESMGNYYFFHFGDIYIYVTTRCHTWLQRQSGIWKVAVVVEIFQSSNTTMWIHKMIPPPPEGKYLKILWGMQHLACFIHEWVTWARHIFE